MNNTWGMVKKNIVVHLTAALLVALVAFVGSAWLGCLLGAAVYFAFLVMQYADGADRGERACTMTATIQRLEAEGKQADDRMKKQVYAPVNAVKAFLITALPLAALAVVNLLLADPNAVGETVIGAVTRIVFFPVAWLTRLLAGMVGVDYAGAEAAATTVFGALNRGGIDFAGLVGKLSEVQTYAVAYDLSYLTTMRILYIPAAFLSPLAMMIGYMQGPRMHKKKMDDIAKGSRRKKKKLKVFGRARQPKQVKPEV